VRFGRSLFVPPKLGQIKCGSSWQLPDFFSTYREGNSALCNRAEVPEGGLLLLW